MRCVHSVPNMCLFLLCSLIMCANDRAHYGLMVVFRLHHHYTDESEFIELNINVRYILPSVCLKLNQSPRLSSMQYMGLLVFSLPISHMKFGSLSLCFEARCNGDVDFIHNQLVSAHANAAWQLASYPSTVGFITRDSFANISTVLSN